MGVRCNAESSVLRVVSAMLICGLVVAADVCGQHRSDHVAWRGMLVELRYY
jgi:hypothetical protein